MSWMNGMELCEKYTDPEFHKRFADIFALCFLLHECLVPADYKPPGSLTNAISLTELGGKWVPRIVKQVSKITAAEAKVALFTIFHHQELFVDVTETECEPVRAALDSEISSGRIKLPWVYDRLLYDRFFEMFPGRTDELSCEETRKLLEGTPQGVFQLRQFVTGPFGVLNSCCHRLLPPELRPVLWHCSDPSCGAQHRVSLTTDETVISKAATFVREESEKAEGQSSEWLAFFEHIVAAADHYDDTNCKTFPFLLADAFSENELRNLLKQLLLEHSKDIRARFPGGGRFKRILSGSAEDIAQRLNKTECFQLIMLMSDEAIAHCVESLIEESVIEIPVTETRTARHWYVSGGGFKIVHQCSRLGLRSVSLGRNVSLARLKRLITQISGEGKALRDLWWKLRYLSGHSNRERLDTYIHSQDPKYIIRDVVLSSPDHLQRAVKTLRYGRFLTPQSPQDEDRLIDKILWKLGFNVRVFPPHQHRFWNRLDKFLETATTSGTHDERHKEQVRGAGVNFFVSLEEILDRSLSFAAWMLLSDHYGATKFKYNLETARRFMACCLNGLRLGSNEPLQFDPDGKNTLYALIQGFAVLGQSCHETMQRPAPELRRPSAELPGYHAETEIQLFPFLHKALILDVDEAEMLRVIDVLKRVTAALESSRVCDIRNRIDHTRPDFPSREDIQLVCGAVRDTVREMEHIGICPLIYLYRGNTVDEYGRGYHTLQNYRGTQLRIIEPSQYGLCGLPAVDAPQIIVPGIHLRDSSEHIRFQFEESSDCVALWRDYPKRMPRVGPGPPELPTSPRVDHPASS